MRILSILVISLLAVVLFAGVAAADPVDLNPDEDLQGEGVAGDPYIVTNASELQAIQGNLTAHYELGNDIDASETAEWNEDGGVYLGFDPIGDSGDRFTGHFNGSGHTISNLYIDRIWQSDVGLFGAVDSGGAVENVGLENVSVTGSNSVGGLVGDNFGGTVSESYATGSVEGDIYVGGLVGYNSGDVSESYATSNVTGSIEVGGLVGYNLGVVSESYAASNVTGSGSFVGGLVGFNFDEVSKSYATGNVTGSGDDVGGLVGANDGTVSETYATGNVTGSGDYIGGLVGNNYDDVEESYWDRGTTNQDEAIGEGDGTNLVGFGDTSVTEPAAEMQGINATVEMHRLDFVDTWRPGDTTTPDLAWDSEFDSTVDVMAGDGDSDPYQITTVYELQAMNYNLGANYTLANDIDAERTDEWFEDGGTPQGFDPIGDWGDRFTGTFNGSGHTISDLYIDRSSENYVGLFGVVDTDVTIEKIGLENVNVEGDRNVGGLVGRNSGEVRESYATGSIEGDWNVGGLVGDNFGGEVRESYATGSVDVRSDWVGGLVGDNSGTISESFATGGVNGSGEGVGGLVGDLRNSGTISKSYATGTVDGNGGNRVGGLVGYVRSSADSISGSYAVGSVNGSGSTVGGLVGESEDGDGDITDSFWNIDTTGQSNSGGGTGLSAAQMTGINATESANMGALDFTSKWIAVDSYPLVTSSITGLDLTLAEDSVTAGESTDATVTLTLADSTTATATTTSDYSSDDTGVATVDAGTVTTGSSGSATLTAELSGFTDTASISVAAAPASPSGGSSGSSPPPSLELSVTEDVTVEATNARAGDVVRIAPETTGSSDSLGERGSVGVDSISVELATDRDFWMVVDTFERGTTGSSGTDGQADDADLSETRSNISTAFETDTSTLSAGYVTVTHNLEPEDVSNVTFEFSVQEARLDEDGLTPESITLHRQSDGWAPLPTQHLETNETEVRFEATSPGFSSFAIGTGEPLTRVTEATLAASELIEGDHASVAATVENRGEIAAEHTVELTADGETVATETLTLGPGETDETTLSFEPSVGAYDLAVDGRHVDSLTVAEAPATDSPDDEPAVADDDADESVTSGVGESGSLIWILLIILAAASALGVMLRRKGYRWDDLSSK